MIQDFTVLQNIDKPQITMISGPVSYTRFKIFNNDIQLKEIEIFGDEHESESNNCTEQGESCIYVSRTDVVVDKRNEINCVDIPTYLGYAIIDAHKNKQYTDIYIESLQQELGRESYNPETIDLVWKYGYLIRAEAFLKPCGSAINRNELCRDKIKEDSTSTRVPPNIERNWARVHSVDIRTDTSDYRLHDALVEAMRIEDYRHIVWKKKGIAMFKYLSSVMDRFVKAFIEEDLGQAMKDIFLPFYKTVYPGEHKDAIKHVKTHYPIIHILMREFGGYDDYQHKEEVILVPRSQKGTLVLETQFEGKTRITHRIGKTYSKIINMKKNYVVTDLQYIMIEAYEKFVDGIQSKDQSNIDSIIGELNTINSQTSYTRIFDITMLLLDMLTDIFVDLYDVYAIGRMVTPGGSLLNKVPESERLIYFAGNYHCNNLRKYIILYLIPELSKVNDNNSIDVHYSLTQDINIEKHHINDETDRCMRITNNIINEKLL